MSPSSEGEPSLVDAVFTANGVVVDVHDLDRPQRDTTGGSDDVTTGDGPLNTETRRFIESAHIEGEIRDASTNQLLAAGVDRRRREGALPIDTWAEVDRALEFWAARVCARLEARTEGRATH